MPLHFAFVFVVTWVVAARPAPVKPLSGTGETRDQTVTPASRHAGTTVKLLHWNIEHGTLHDATGKENGESLEDVEKVIRHFDPDLVTLVEVRNEDQARSIAEVLGMHYAFGYTIRNLQGNAILSKTPITEKKVYPLLHKEWEQRICVEVGTIIEGQPVHVYATHLTFNSKSDKEGQVIDLLDILRSETGTRILCGDFNDMDNRPNGYSSTGYINLITGSGHGTILPSLPKMFDFQRKCSIPEQTKNDPPFYSLQTDWDPPMNAANTISQWKPRVRIDHIFVSPNVWLGAPENRCEAVDSRRVLTEIEGKDPGIYVSDHRPVFATFLLPRPPVKLFLYPLEGPCTVPRGQSFTFSVGGIDSDGNAVSLYRTDSSSPPDDPTATARMVSAVEWSLTGDIGELKKLEFRGPYDPMRKFDRPYCGAATFTATKVGEGTVTARVDGFSVSVPVAVIPAGVPYIIKK